MDNQKQEKAAIGKRLRAIRQRAHISVEEAAQAATVQPLAVQKWEKGTALPSLLEFRALLQLYGVMACEVLFETSPIELSAEHVSELSKAAANFTPGLRARVDYLLAIFARGKEPEWNVVLPGE
jgi:transcriptional regulator with XRE-family HTH domain